MGLDHVISAKTKEMVHDRSDVSINIRMFSPVNVMVGRDGDAKASKVKQDTDGVQIEMSDRWAELSSISQLDEAMDNLVRLWLVMWPFDYGPANLKGVLGKHKNFAVSFENLNTRKKIVEDFINRILGDNAVRAGQGIPPLSFKEVEERAKEVTERKQDYVRFQGRNVAASNRTGFQQRQSNNKPAGNKPQQNNPAFSRLQSFLKTQKGSDDICIWFNIKDGCQSQNCPRKHVCCKLPAGQKELCRENHSMMGCKKK